MIRVVVVDDEVLLRGALAQLLNGDPGLAVVGQAGDGASAVDLVARLRPDVVLMDIRMPGTDGVAATRAICAAESGTRILALSTFGLDEYVLGALRAGASGYLLKNCAPEEVLRAVHVVAAGHALLAPEVTRTLIARVPPEDLGPPPVLPGLTPREREVLSLVARGLSNQEIAARLVLSPSTAKTYVSRLMAKLHARDRAQLVVLAHESGLMRRA